MRFHVRKCRPGEESDLWNLFFQTIRRINVRDYSPAQVRAWAPDEVAPELWRERIQKMAPTVCLADDMIVGYAGMAGAGHIDHFYVHHAWQRRGIGSLLYETLESEAVGSGIGELTADVSITARPFFESRGFRVIKLQEVKIGSVGLPNFSMAKTLRVE